jgi:hypothetical protein
MNATEKPRPRPKGSKRKASAQSQDGLGASAGSACGVEAEVCNDIAERQRLGIRKYGATVATNPLHLREWLQHAYEEHLDAAIYLKRAMGMLAHPCGEYGGLMGNCPRWQHGLCTCQSNA